MLVKRDTIPSLWGAEWWYWLKQHGHTEMWEKGMDVYSR